MIRQLAALCAATALLATALPATQSTAATQSGAAESSACTKTVLPLPADSEPGVSLVRAADPSGRYIIGHASRQGRQSSQGVLWVDGVPRWLGTQPDSESYGWAIAGSFVLGTTGNQAGTDYWIYSIKTDSYRILQVPEGLQIAAFTGMNARQDIIGVAWDDESQFSLHAFVWPAGGQPRLLPTPKGMKAFSVDDISDEGRIIGSVGTPDATDITSYLWNSWNSRPIRLRGLRQDSLVWARDIEGTRIGGQEGQGSASTGFIWNTHGSRTARFEDAVADLNSSGDVVTAGDDNFDNYPSVLIRSNGTRLTFPEGTFLNHIFDRNAPWTAGGYEHIPGGEMTAVAYKCGT